ncbi:hypothetical protein QWY20_12480 [Alkalimonas sp. MEB108]|uniref:Uncharacterized protein n=1 Tax=Alkalimonas cellulosilytica TaxID=3058395 RepID=A0ABU7J6Y1_9GAMM|nr:hypothetical protein [Alkalimonas sp. MEB108]MEE2002271.1 hypothetical protein [Alkalimonas sp. MEB108]
MNVKTMLADFLSFVTPTTKHKTRCSALLSVTQSSVKHNHCSVTAIGRGIDSTTSEKLSIKRSDSLLSNTTLTAEMPVIYTLMPRAVLAQSKHLVVLVYMNNADTQKKHHSKIQHGFRGWSLTLLHMVQLMTSIAHGCTYSF